MIGISLLAFIPALLLCIYVYIKDKVEKEPLWLLFLLFALGALICLPVKLGQEQLVGLIDRAFDGKVTFSVSGIAEYDPPNLKYLHDALCGFFGAALIEEGVKWLTVFFVTRKNKNFDCLFDGVVYHVFLSLGFALCDSVVRAVNEGGDTLLLRAVTTVPAHLLFGVVSGFFYTLWKTFSVASEKEDALIAKGKLRVKKIKKAPLLLCLSLLVPVAVHGIYGFADIDGGKQLRFIYYVTVILLWALCFVITRALSKRDDKNEMIAKALIRKAHPGENGAFDTDDRSESSDEGRGEKV